MQWWCSASGQAWTWEWQAYPGVWLMVLALGFLYYRLTRGATPDAKRSVKLGWAGVVLIWLSLDWPLGPLAAGYLASAHAMQFMFIALGAAPLLLIGIRAAATDKLSTTGASGALLRLMTHPLVGATFFNAITIASHVSGVLDTLRVSQLGSFVIDLAWLVSALCFWWCIIVPVPARPRFNGLFQVLYLFLGTMFHTVLAIILLIADTPFYGVYELAPPMTRLTSLQDQHIAGAIMELIGAAIIFPILSYRFFRWVRESEQDADNVTERMIQRAHKEI